MLTVNLQEGQVPWNSSHTALGKHKLWLAHACLCPSPLFLLPWTIVMMICIAANDKGAAMLMAYAITVRVSASATNWAGLVSVPKALVFHLLLLLMPGESWFSSTSPLCLLTVSSPQHTPTTSGTLTSTTRVLSSVSAGTVLLTPWALNSPWRF